MSPWSFGTDLSSVLAYAGALILPVLAPLALLLGILFAFFVVHRVMWGMDRWVATRRSMKDDGL